MTRKYTKAQRELAAWWCQVMASDRAAGCWLEVEPEFEDPGARDLALAAFFAVPWVSGRMGLALQWAEAESWIRTGWEP